MVDYFTSYFYKFLALIIDVNDFLLILPRRLSYKIWRERKIKQYLNSIESIVAKVQDFDFHTVPHTNAVLPGGNCKVYLEKYYAENNFLKEHVEQAFNHQLIILSKSYLDTNSTAEVNNEKVYSLLANTFPGKSYLYNPISWHTDFKSGYKWDDCSLYNRIQVAEKKDADIKIPRELSRFNHVGLLASAKIVIGRTGADEFMYQVVDWIASNKMGYGVNWACAMDVGLRAVNWIWAYKFFQTDIEKYPEFVKLFKKSLYFHAIHIEHNLEYSTVAAGNHYLSDIVGMLYIASFLTEVEESDSWLIFSIQELLSEMRNEVYLDGYSHEGSTHYHRLVAELFLSGALLIERIPLNRINIIKSKKNLLNTFPKLRTQVFKLIHTAKSYNALPDWFYQKLYKMILLTSAITKSNYNVPQIGDNDSARVHKLIVAYPENFSDHRHLMATASIMYQIDFNDIEFDTASLTEALILTDGVHLKFHEHIKESIPSVSEMSYYKDAGIAVRKNTRSNLIVTCGQNGQRRRGGHNHNDKLSFELNIDGYDLFVDPGCAVYTASPEKRNFYRSTKSHNTVVLEHSEQDKWKGGVAGLFSLRQRTWPKLWTYKKLIKGVHYGYPVPHHRSFDLKEKELCINDYIRGRKNKYFNLIVHPDVDVRECTLVNNIFSCTLKLKNGLLVVLKSNQVLDFAITDVPYSYSYGVEITTKRISLNFRSNTLITNIIWY